MGLLGNLWMTTRLAWRLPRFLRDPLPPGEARNAIRRGVAQREASFLRVVERGIFQQPSSPYLQLLRMADCGPGDLQRMVRSSGVEGTLQALRSAGVYLSFDEFKCRRPVERDGRVFHFRPRDFENPLLTKHYEGRTGGSTGRGTRLFVDLDLLTLEAASHSLFLQAFGIMDRPMGLWRPLPPGVAGVMNVLRQAKAGRTVEKWFTQDPVRWRGEAFGNRLITSLALRTGRLAGCRLPIPEYVPLPAAETVARWLAGKRGNGTPAIMDTYASSGVRICLAAQDAGLDISGTFFRLGGEPFTEAKARCIEGVGCRAISHYSLSELGRVGVACAAPASRDDVHLLTDKLAVIQHDTRVRDTGRQVPALVFTTLHPSCPLLMLNVATDDYAVVEERNCDCPIGEAGLRRHIRDIRSYEKLNSEGMTFFGIDLYHLVEDVLPARFGGQPTDYQLQETEQNGLTRVNIVVHPRIGPVEDEVVISTVGHALRKVPDGEMMTRHWQDGETFRVVRRTPASTAASKILPLHVPRSTDRDRSEA